MSSVDLVAMLGEPVRTVRESLVRLAELGAIVARIGRGYRALASPDQTTDAAPLPELTPEAPSAEATTDIISVVAPEPSPAETPELEPVHVAVEEPEEPAPDTVRTDAPAFDEEELVPEAPPVEASTAPHVTGPTDRDPCEKPQDAASTSPPQAPARPLAPWERRRLIALKVPLMGVDIARFGPPTSVV